LERLIFEFEEAGLIIWTGDFWNLKEGELFWGYWRYEVLVVG
jgi:hypothetical protein